MASKGKGKQPPKREKRNYYLNNPNLPTPAATFEYTPEMVRDIKLSKDSLLYFASTFFYIINLDEGRQVIKLHPYQTRVLNKMENNRFFILLSGRQIGKALALYTPISTPSGWTTMEGLKEGDQVYGVDGKPCNVVHAHDILYNRDCYELVFDNGDEIVADAEHLWSVVDEEGVSSIKTTKEIYEGGIYYIPKNTDKIYITSMRKVDSVPVRCITVDSSDNLFLCGKTMIPTHNSTMLTIYALWLLCFNQDQRVVIVANKEATAIEIFKRVRLAYEELPAWLKPGVLEYGKTSMKLANGSEASISTTTGSAVRGLSINCVHGDSKVTVRDKETGEVFECSMIELKNKIGETK